MVTSMTFSTRSWMPPIARTLPSTERFHSRMAATNSAAIDNVLPRDEAGIEFVERLARPEHLLELVGFAACAAEGEQLLDDDRPRPDRGEQQADHHELDDDVGLQEQLDHREAAGCRARNRNFALHQIQWVHDRPNFPAHSLTGPP